MSISKLTFNHLFLGFFCFLFNLGTISGQLWNENTDIDLKVKTTGHLLKHNKLVLVIEMEIPDGWKLKVEKGFESIWGDGLDTVDMALRFAEKPGYRLIQRLKSDRKPSAQGYFYDKITFAQTMAIDTSKLPLNIDAELKWFLQSMDEKRFARGLPCCLLKVCKKRENVETLSIGWNCNRRNRVYLEDVLN